MPRTDRSTPAQRSRSRPPAVRGAPAEPAPNRLPREDEAAGFFHNPRVLAFLLVVVTVVTFSPLLTADFTNWDDPQTIAHNPRFNPPSLANLAYFWDPRHPYMDLYVPVTYTV